MDDIADVRLSCQPPLKAYCPKTLIADGNVQTDRAVSIAGFADEADHLNSLTSYPLNTHGN